MKAPTEDIFTEMKHAATQIWRTYDNQYGYVDEKLKIVNNLTNVEDNAMVFYRMFDSMNQAMFKSLVSEDTRNYILNNL